MKASASGRPTAPVSNSRVAPVRLAVTSLVSPAYANRASMTNSGSTVTSAMTASTSPPVNTASPASAAQASKEGGRVRPDPRAEVCELHGDHWPRQRNEQADNGAPTGSEDFALPC